MANIVVTSTTNAIKVVFNDETQFGMVKGTFAKDSISTATLTASTVNIVMDNGFEWQVTHDSGNTEPSIGIVDSVDAVAPSSLSDLYDKISALIE